MKKVAIYARVSTKDQTVEQQLKELKDYCQRSNFVLAKEYIDEGVSAFKNRPAFNRLLEDIRQRKLDMVLVYKIDRFARSTRELLNVIDEIKQNGVDFVSFTQREFDTTTSSGKLMLTILAGISEFERDLISERTKLKLAYLKDKGVKLGRPQKVDYDEVIELRQQGLSLGKIAKKIGCDRSTVSKVLKKYNCGINQ